MCYYGVMSDIGRIEFMLVTRAIPPAQMRPGDYHYELMPCDHAFALEAALQAKGDYFGTISRAIHPNKYDVPNPNPYYAEGIDPFQGLVGFRFEVLGTDDIRKAYQDVYDIIHDAIGDDHDYHLSEVMVSRIGMGRHQSRVSSYHPKYNPNGI